MKRGFCALCEHELMFFGGRCSRRSTHWGELNPETMIPLCHHHAMIFAAAQLGDVWEMVDGDPIADLEYLMMHQGPALGDV